MNFTGTKSNDSRVHNCQFSLFSLLGEPGECLSHLRHRSAPGGSGAGGSVVIKAKKLKGDPRGKISVSGAGPVKCGFGAGGGLLKTHIKPLISNITLQILLSYCHTLLIAEAGRIS